MGLSKEMLQCVVLEREGILCRKFKLSMILRVFFFFTYSFILQMENADSEDMSDLSRVPQLVRVGTKTWGPKLMFFTL